MCGTLNANDHQSEEIEKYLMESNFEVMPKCTVFPRSWYSGTVDLSQKTPIHQLFKT
uniref:Uncharacterized protein n=1 Tax=Anguilla anguilla TaxID=7936 RepID=A0A0E9W7V9_ANGAN